MQSDFGAGSRFSFALPLDERRPPSRQRRMRPRDGDRRRLRVLVAGQRGQPVLRSLRLEHVGFAVVTAENGREAIEPACAHRPDAILMDIQMPEMDGFAAMTHRRPTRRGGATPVIALTAYAMQHEREQAMAAGCVGDIEETDRHPDLECSGGLAYLCATPQG